MSAASEIVSGLKKPGEALEAPKDAVKTLVKRPWLAVGMVFFVLVVVVLFEAYKPGAVTGPIRRLLSKVGLIKGA